MKEKTLLRHYFFFHKYHGTFPYTLLNRNYLESEFHAEKTQQGHGPNKCLQTTSENAIYDNLDFDDIRSTLMRPDASQN
jgi:hypothetical protein